MRHQALQLRSPCPALRRPWLHATKEGFEQNEVYRQLLTKAEKVGRDFAKAYFGADGQADDAAAEEPDDSDDEGSVVSVVRHGELASVVLR